jgi:SAM-dependent methyltransferase
VTSHPSDIRLLCPACRSPLDATLGCPGCSTRFERDPCSNVIRLERGQDAKREEAVSPWDERWAGEPLELTEGLRTRLDQRRWLVDPGHVSRRVLDLGAGTGFNVVLLDSGRIDLYVGVDLSIAGLRRASRLLSSARIPHVLLCCDASRHIPLEGRFDTILSFGFLYQFDHYRELFEAILDVHAGVGARVYGAEPVQAVGSPSRVRRSDFLRLLRSRGAVDAYFMEGLVHRVAHKVSHPRWLRRSSALWTARSAALTPFARYLQYALKVNEAGGAPRARAR